MNVYYTSRKTQDILKILIRQISLTGTDHCNSKLSENIFSLKKIFTQFFNILENLKEKKYLKVALLRIIARFFKHSIVQTF